MIDQIFKLVEESAERMGGCDPRWLKEHIRPDFITEEDVDNSLPPVILLHGLFGALSNWGSLVPLISNFCRPIALQFPILNGHRSEVKVKALAAFTEFFIRLRDIAPVVLCGNSLGGHVALRLCLARPELVDCLILSGTSGLYEHTVDTLPVRPDRKFVDEHMRRVFYNEEFITSDRTDEILEILSRRANHLNLIHSARSAKKDNMLEHLKHILPPTLLLWGEDDEVTTMTVARMFEQHLPNAELRTIKNCGHAPMIEHPAWFAEQMKDFLSKHSSKFCK